MQPLVSLISIMHSLYEIQKNVWSLSAISGGGGVAWRGAAAAVAVAVVAGPLFNF